MWTWPIFFAAVALGAFFIVNLALAVLYLQFSKDREEEEGGTAGTCNHVLGFGLFVQAASVCTRAAAVQTWRKPRCMCVLLQGLHACFGSSPDLKAFPCLLLSCDPLTVFLHISTLPSQTWQQSARQLQRPVHKWKQQPQQRGSWARA